MAGRPEKGARTGQNKESQYIHSNRRPSSGRRKIEIRSGDWTQGDLNLGEFALEPRSCHVRFLDRVDQL